MFNKIIHWLEVWEIRRTKRRIKKYENYVSKVKIWLKKDKKEVAKLIKRYFKKYDNSN